jgi:hypothetical protein
MIKKLLPLALLLPMLSVAQANKQSQEIQAKAIAAQEYVAPTVNTQRLLDCTASDVPYLEDFESVTVPGFGECTSLENAGTGNNWETAANPGYGFGTTQVMRYKWHTTSAANAWFYTNGLNLEAGQTYNISYRYGSAGANVYTEKLKVHVGTNTSAASMDPVPLIDHPLVNNNVTPLVDNLTFTPATSGVYFIGFNCYSNIDQFYLFVDDIAVSAVLATNSFDTVALNYYPNPVRDVLNIDARQQLDSVTIYNLLGQMVSQTAVGSEKAQIDLRSLPKGNYLAKVVSGKSERTFKVSKN